MATTSPKAVLAAALWAASGMSGCGALADEASQADAKEACDPSRVDLIITELMPNPTGPDPGHEWLEIYNRGTEPLCLNGAVLHVGPPWAPKARPLRNIGCLPPQSLWLLGDGAHRPGDTLGAGAAAAPHYRYGALVMPNDMGAVAISCAGQVLDAVEYGPDAEAPVPKAGRALARVPMAPGAPFCSVTGPADARGDVGSPGLENPGCSTCQDGDGALRARRPPPPGALEVAHYRALAPDPNGGGPWAELTLVAQGAPFDLAGLRLEALSKGRRPRSWQVPEGPCHAVAPGGTEVLLLTGPAPPAGPGLWGVGRRPPPKGPLTLRLWARESCIAEVPLPLAPAAPASAPTDAPPCD